MSQPFFSTRSDLADVRLLSYLWTARRPSASLSTASNATAHLAATLAATLDATGFSTRAVDAASSSSRPVLLAQSSPLLISGVVIFVPVIRHAARRVFARSKSTRGGDARPRWFNYFAPFVTEQDVRQHRLELSRQSQRASSDDSETLASSVGTDLVDMLGFQRQRRRLDRLLLVALFQAAAWATATGWETAFSEHAQMIPCLSQVIAWIIIFFRLLLRPPQTPSFDLVALLFSLNVAAWIHLFSFVPSLGSNLRALDAQLLLSIANTVICIYVASLCLRMPVTPGGYEAVVDLDERIRQQTDATSKTSFPGEGTDAVYRLCPTSPEDYCSLYENLSYSWMAPIQSLALRRSLRPTDVWRLRGINDTRLLFRKFKALEATQEKPRLLSRILRANANDILLDACFKLVSVSFAYLGTYILKSILDQIQIAATHDGSQSGQSSNADDTDWTPRQKAFAYACIGLCLTVVRFLAELQNFHHARQVGLRLRSTLVVSLFEKALKRRDLSGQTKSTSSDQPEKGNGTEAPADDATPSSIRSESPIGSDGEAPAAADSNEAAPLDQQLRPPQQTDLRQKRSWTASLRVDKLKQVSFESLRSNLAQRIAQRKKRQAQKLKEQEEQQGADVGKVVNLMASDVNILLRMGCDLHQLYGAPLEVTIAAIFLYKLMGWSALVGFGILVAAIPVNYVWGEIAVQKQREYSAARDARMSLLSELIDAMRFVKIQGVEPQWEQRVADARRTEMRRLVWSRVMTFLFELLWTVIPVLVTLVSFFFYVKAAKEELTVSTAFTAIALFTMIRPPLNAIPGFLMGGLIAMVSVQRLESFLNEQEVEEAISQLSEQRSAAESQHDGYKDEDVDEPARAHEGNGIVNEEELAIKGCSFFWHSTQTTMRPASDEGTANGDRPADSEHHTFALRDIDVSFPAGELTLIVGPTGSGKSSMLAAILGEMLQLHEGTVVRHKFDQHGRSRFSYANQLPWLEAGKSVRDNILFGTPFDQARYDMCIHACALHDDLDSMDDGDLTRIGSHTVSGGQKARISLARALYARSSTVLLDDVLSAVDTRVQNHIVKHAVLGEIAKRRRVILVTHHAHLLMDRAALVVSMENGRVAHQGTPSDLQARGVLSGSHVQSRDTTRSDRGETSAANTDDTDAQELGTSVDSTLHPDAAHVTLDNGAAETTSTPKRTGELASGARTPRLLHQEEKRREGAVSWVFYRTYLQASSLRIWGVLVVLLLLLRLSESFGQYWLKVWGEAYKDYGLRSLATILASSHLPFDLPPADGHAGFYLSVYGLSGLAVILFNSSRAICFYVASIRASQNLFTTLLANVIRAPLRWFDTTPAGRIMNRFGTDMDCIDNILPQSIMNLGNNAFSMAAYLLICVAIVPAFVLPCLVLALAGPWLVGGFLACTRDMQRIEATSTSPIYAHFQQALSGIVTVRAFGAEPRLLESMLDAVDVYQALWWAVCTMEVWLSFRSQVLGGVSVFVVTLLALSGAVSPGSAGLALSSAQLLCQLAYYLVNDFKNLANSFNSLERVAEYQQMAREENEHVVAGYSASLVPAAWPSRRAGIVFDNVSLRYADDLPLVLKRVSFDVQPGEKVGIIGRTGSGKSSLAASLLRAVELCGGRIVVDGVDISTVPLQQLRSRLSIVMQDPVLFSGTVRENLDPFGEHDDAQVLDALTKVGLAAAPSSTPGASTPPPGTPSRLNMRLRLDTRVSSGGANFSAGQAQLLSLARALLRSTRILILDEATSSTDMHTDAMVQRVIRTSLSDSIVLCIAHRLKSVIDYDRVVVLQDGRVVECGSPRELLLKREEEEGAFFRRLCGQSADYAQLCAATGVEG
ncbi:related to YBT1-Vacuolar, full-size ABC protein transporting bile acids [Sporisorium reilianum f. sp. reilianum]|uniref:Related to YBT1-Vacuolar, full-size ABC protein transporting bile acids n=1 Tax=Sporisorium reilianum f. sp. reilianum TaxID=72559 RepID=A0A2N8UJS0_9BASI|nr:related to YBT1-Vacuolar, full-size ABC protein transporting bile acids [Sporisorium reilianum f. sp. reilianum]